MTFLALAGKCGALGASGLAEVLTAALAEKACENAPSLISEPSASVPMPVVQRCKNCRRVSYLICSRRRSIASAFGYHFVQIQQYIGNDRPGGDFRNISA